MPRLSGKLKVYRLVRIGIHANLRVEKEIMRPLILMILIWTFLAGSLPLFAETEGSTPISQELKNLSKKIEEIKKQDQTILQNQTKILEELQVLKVRVRRG